MIHVCQIDVGCRYVFDMAHGIDDVLSLKQAIEKQTGAALLEQILLISGGEVLKNQRQKLFGLSAGIEESPIYLIDAKNVKQLSQSKLQQQQQQQMAAAFQDMSKEIDEAVNLLEPSYQTVLMRTQLAVKVYDNDFKLSKLCEQYYMDQYWQYQGFMALIANLDDTLTSIEKMYDSTREQFLSYNQSKTNNLKHISEIETYIKLLSTINLLPELSDYASKNLTLFQSVCSQQPGGGGLHYSSSSSSVITTAEMLPQSPSSTISSSYNNIPSPNSTQDISQCQQQHVPTLNLLEWTNLTDPRHKLESVLLKAKESFEYLDSNWWTQIENEIKILINEGNNMQMKEIQGLTKRLSELNSLIDTCKVSLNREKEIVDSFKTHLNRVATEKDESIMQDLCIGHESSLALLSENHTKIVDITRRICKAKCELTKVINQRLNWVMTIQTQLVSGLNMKLIVCNEKIRQSNLYMKQVEQIKNAPNVYFQALHETIRREKFSSLYKDFANEIYSIVSDITKAEHKRREEFAKKFSRNYVMNLFPYLGDTVYSFVKSELNLNFDLNMPRFNESCIRQLEDEFKQETVAIARRDDGAAAGELRLLEILNTRLKNEIIKFRFDEQANGESGNGSAAAMSGQQAILPTDTSALFLSKLTDTQIANSDNDEQLVLVNKKPAANKEFLDKLEEIYKREIGELRGNLEIIREDYEQLQKQVRGEYKQFEGLILALNKQLASGRMRKQQFYKSLLENLFSSAVAESSADDVTAGDTTLDDDTIDERFCANLKERLMKLRETYDKSVEDTRKCMDSLKMNFLADKQKVFNEAIERVTKEKDRQIDELKAQQEKLHAEVKQLKQLQQANLQKTTATDTEKEDTLQRGMVKQQRLVERVQYLEQQLSRCMQQSGSSRIAASMSANAVTQQPSSLLQIAGSPPSSSSEAPLQLPRYQPLSNAIQLNSCAIGDLVLIIYDFTHSSYRIIYQQSPYIHFIHTDSIKIFDTSSQIYKEFVNSNEQQQPLVDAVQQQQQSSSLPSSPASPSNLDDTFANYNFTKEAIQSLIGPSVYNNSSNLLSSSLVQPKEQQQQQLLTSTSTLVSSSAFLNTSTLGSSSSSLHKPLWFIGRVVNKEFCIARKENNRYKVPSGTQFYRVRVYPYKV